MPVIRTHVTFATRRFRAVEPDPDDPSGDECVNGSDCARWLGAKLPALGIQTPPEPFMEDWGWGTRATVDGRRFWIGTSPLSFSDAEHGATEWIVHVHHWTVFQRFTRPGRLAMLRLAVTIDRLLRTTDGFEQVRWHHARAVRQNQFDAWAESPGAP